MVQRRSVRYIAEQRVLWYWRVFMMVTLKMKAWLEELMMKCKFFLLSHQSCLLKSNVCREQQVNQSFPPSFIKQAIRFTAHHMLCFHNGHFQVRNICLFHLCFKGPVWEKVEFPSHSQLVNNKHFGLGADPTYNPKASVFGNVTQKSMFLQIGPLIVCISTWSTAYKHLKM